MPHCCCFSRCRFLWSPACTWAHFLWKLSPLSRSRPLLFCCPFCPLPHSSTSFGGITFYKSGVKRICFMPFLPLFWRCFTCVWPAASALGWSHFFHQRPRHPFCYSCW